jgi:O-antigen/teichoic acid export membrane protein
MNVAQKTVRNAELVLIQRGIYIATTFLFAFFIPRTMGPSPYGQFALLYSLSFIFTMLSDFGVIQVMGRYIPQLNLQGEIENSKKLLNSFLMLTLSSGTFAASLYLLITYFWLKDIHFFSLLTMAITVLIRSCTNPLFSFFLGLNQAARWGSRDVLGRLLSIPLLILFFKIGGLSGACLGLLLTEVFILILGIWWGRPYLSRSHMHLDLHFLYPYLQFGLFFFISHLTNVAIQNGGGVLIRMLNPDYTQVSYFELAQKIFLTASLAYPQFSLSFAPLMTILLKKDKTDTLQQWAEQLMKWLTVAGVGIMFSFLFLGEDLVRLILGKAYQPVATNLLPLSVAFFFSALSSVSNLITLVYEKPRVALTASILRLAIFWGAGFFFVTFWGSFGGCLAILTASIFYASYLTWQTRAHLPYSLRRWIFAIGLGALFLPLLWFRSSLPVNVVLFIFFLVGYMVILFLFRIITWSEVRTLGKSIASGIFRS